MRTRRNSAPEVNEEFREVKAYGANQLAYRTPLPPPHTHTTSFYDTPALATVINRRSLYFYATATETETATYEIRIASKSDDTRGHSDIIYIAVCI